MAKIQIIISANVRYSNTLIFSNLDPGTPPLGIIVRGGGLSSEFFNFSKNQHPLPVALHHHLIESAFGYECYLLRASCGRGVH